MVWMLYMKINADDEVYLIYSSKTSDSLSVCCSFTVCCVLFNVYGDISISKKERRIYQWSSTSHSVNIFHYWAYHYDIVQNASSILLSAFIRALSACGVCVFIFVDLFHSFSPFNLKKSLGENGNSTLKTCYLTLDYGVYI